MEGGGQVDEEGAHQAGIGNSRHEHHQNPDKQELLAVQPGGAFEKASATGHDQRKPEKNKKRCQGEVSPTERRGLSEGIIERGQRTDADRQKKPQKNGAWSKR